MGFFQKLQARIELKRLENRYVTRKKRNTWMSDAIYVDGEYVFPSSKAAPAVSSNSPASPTASFGAASHRSKSSWSWSSSKGAAPPTRFAGSPVRTVPEV